MNSVWPIVLFVVLLVGLFGIAVIPAFDVETETVLVEDKGVKRSSENSDRYLIYTDRGTFTITDSLVHTRWNSSDVYGRIKIGKTYNIRHAGWRVPFFSMYENILEATEVKSDA